MARDPWFTNKFRYLRWFALIAAIGLVSLFVGGTSELGSRSGAFRLGMLLIIPFVMLATIIPIWYWKDRYRGTRSSLWGALLIVETTGIVRIVYWIRHVLEDAWGKGRYSKESSN